MSLLLARLAVQPTPQPPNEVVGGGFGYPLDARRSPRNAPKSVVKVIERLAKKQVDSLENKDYERQLITELSRLDLQYKEAYLEVLAYERQKLINAEIQRLMEIKKKEYEEYEAIGLLMAMM